jgi:hypothetical protein
VGCLLPALKEAVKLKVEVLLNSWSEHQTWLVKNSIDTRGKLRLNLHSLSVSELLEYKR